MLVFFCRSIFKVLKVFLRPVSGFPLTGRLYILPNHLPFVNSLFFFFLKVFFIQFSNSTFYYTNCIDSTGFADADSCSSAAGML